MKTQRRAIRRVVCISTTVLGTSGIVSMAQKNPVAHRLASTEDYPKKSEVIPLKKEFMERVNRTANLPNAGITIVDFFENVYLPAITGEIGTVNREGVQGFLALSHQRSREGPGQGLPDGGW